MTGGYTNPGALAVGTSRQVAVATQVIATVNVAAPDNASPMANVQIAPDNLTWDTIAQVGNDFDVSGVLGATGNSNVRANTTFEIPAGWWYRVTKTGTGGTVTISQLRERNI